MKTSPPASPSTPTAAAAAPPTASATTATTSATTAATTAAPATPSGGNESADDDFADLGVDDDDLLGLGNDFNILEYADPELQLDCANDCGKGEAEGEAEDFNILEYADPDLDTGDDETVTGSRKNLLEEHLALADEVSKKEAEENAAKVAQGVSEFQAKLLEFTEKQQNLAVIHPIHPIHPSIHPSHPSIYPSSWVFWGSLKEVASWILLGSLWDLSLGAFWDLSLRSSWDLCGIFQ